MTVLRPSQRSSKRLAGHTARAMASRALGALCLAAVLAFGAPVAPSAKADQIAAWDRAATAQRLPAPSAWRVASRHDEATPRPSLVSATRVGAQPARLYAPRPKPRPTPPFSTDARAAVVIDVSTGETLFAKEAERAIEPASMTKLMTAYMTFEALADGRLKDSDKIRVPAQIAGAPGSSMFLKTGQRPRVIDLLRGLIIQSGNDAARLLAVTLAGSEAAFAEAMTRRARQLGLSSASFRNATGLPAQGHRVSVADLARLTLILRREFPERMALFSERGFKWSGIAQRNRNPALFLDLGKGARATGMKTGHTDAAGYCVVASAKQKASARRQERDVIVVLAGLRSEGARRRETAAALEWALEAEGASRR